MRRKENPGDPSPQTPSLFTGSLWFFRLYSILVLCYMVLFFTWFSWLCGSLCPLVVWIVHSLSLCFSWFVSLFLRHRNAAVRKTAAQHLERLAEVMGASRVLSGKKDLTDRFVRSISCLALDSAQEVRWECYFLFLN